MLTRHWKLDAIGLLTVMVFALIFCLSALPMLRLTYTAFWPHGGWDGAGFAARFLKPQVLRAATHTLETSIWGAVVASLIGLPFAFAVGLTDLPARRILSFCLILPLMIAPQVTAIAWLHLFGPSSTLMELLGFPPKIGSGNPMLGRDGIILLLGVQQAPIVFITVRAGLSRLPGDLIEAARAAGASQKRVIVSIVLPLLRPHLLAAVLLAFMSGIGNFGIPALLGLPVNYLTLTTLIYQRLTSTGPDVLPELAALSIAIGLAALCGIVIQSLAMSSRQTYQLTSSKSTRLELGSMRITLAVIAWTIVVGMLILPTAALVATSLIPAFGVPLSVRTITLDNYIEVLFRQASTERAFFNSGLLSAAAAMLLAGFAIPVGWILSRCRSQIRTVLQTMIVLPYAMPGIALSIACILLFLRPLPFAGSLYGTPWIILIAYLMRFLTLATNPVTTQIAQIPSALSEAAAAAGAGPLWRLMTIIAPIVAPAALAGCLLVFMMALNELTVSALLWSHGTETLGVILFSLEEAGLGTQAAAIAIVSQMLVIGILLLLDRLGRSLPAGILPWR